MYKYVSLGCCQSLGTCLDSLYSGGCLLTRSISHSACTQTSTSLQIFWVLGNYSAEAFPAVMASLRKSKSLQSCEINMKVSSVLPICCILYPFWFSAHNSDTLFWSAPAKSYSGDPSLSRGLRDCTEAFEMHPLGFRPLYIHLGSWY